jgi:hypothetical protein
MSKTFAPRAFAFAMAAMVTFSLLAGIDSLAVRESSDPRLAAANAAAPQVSAVASAKQLG